MKHSLWMGWLLTLGLLNWVAFVVLAVRLKERKWLLWAAAYLAPVPVFFFAPFDLSTVEGQTLNAIAGLLIPVAGLVSLGHGIRIRKAYLQRVAPAALEKQAA